MSKLAVYDMKGGAVGEAEFPEALLVGRKGEQAVHDAVVAYRAGLRAGTASTLRKGEVAGSGKKPWRQKGTGRARAGYRQSPVWRGGSVVFGPHPRSYAKKMPRKAARLAFKRALSELVTGGKIRVLDQLSIPEPKTRLCAALLKSHGAADGALIVVDKLDKNLVCSVRNVPNVEVTTAQSVSTYQLLRYPVALVTRAALDALQARVAGETGRAA